MYFAVLLHCESSVFTPKGVITPLGVKKHLRCENISTMIIYTICAVMMELVDMLDLGSSECSRVGSSPSNCTPFLCTV